MPKKSDGRGRSGCPISIALDLFGDSWSLLIVRDLMFKGQNTFHAFLNAGEGIATNILADRLAKLEKAGILSKYRDPMDARCFIYRLTRKGIDLAPMMTELILWSAQNETTDAPHGTVTSMSANPRAFAKAIMKKLTAVEKNE